MHEEAAVRRGADLALVDAAVARLGRVDLEPPVLVRVRQAVRVAVEQPVRLVAEVGLVQRAEPLVRRVRVRGDREQAGGDKHSVNNLPFRLCRREMLT